MNSSNTQITATKRRTDCFTNEQSKATRAVLTPFPGTHCADSIPRNALFLPITAKATSAEARPLHGHAHHLCSMKWNSNYCWTLKKPRDRTLGQLTGPSMPSKYTELGFEANSRLHQGSGSKCHPCHCLFLSHAEGEKITLDTSDSSFLRLGASLKMTGSRPKRKPLYTCTRKVHIHQGASLVFAEDSGHI